MAKFNSCFGRSLKALAISYEPSNLILLFLRFKDKYKRVFGKVLIPITRCERP